MGGFSISNSESFLLDSIYSFTHFGVTVFLQRQGRCDTFATEFDLEAEEYVPLPKGDVHKKKEIVQDVTLHDLDVANARPQVQLNRTDSVPVFRVFCSFLFINGCSLFVLREARTFCP